MRNYSLRFLTESTWATNHCSDDRALEDGGPVTGAVPIRALWRKIREHRSYQPLNQEGKPIFTHEHIVIILPVLGIFSRQKLEYCK